MSQNNGHFEKHFLLVLLFTVLLHLPAASAPGLELPNGGDALLAQISLNTVVRDPGAEIAARCYTVDLPAPGLLALELSGTGMRLAGPRSLHAPLAAKRAAFDVLERLATRRLLAVRIPGTYRFCVHAQDPDGSFEGYKLSNLFTAALPTKDGDPREEEPDPDLLLGQRLSGGCGAVAADDHGDTFLCATPLQLGGEVEGEIWNVWGDDEDLFVFRLEELATVRLESAADNVAFGGLYDRYGHRLDVETRGDSAGWRFVTTLAPGPYAVRLAGDEGLSGAYRLSLEAVDR